MQLRRTALTAWRARPEASTLCRWARSAWRRRRAAGGAGFERLGGQFSVSGVRRLGGQQASRGSVPTVEHRLFSLRMFICSCGERR